MRSGTIPLVVAAAVTGRLGSSTANMTVESLTSMCCTLPAAGIDVSSTGSPVLRFQTYRVEKQVLKDAFKDKKR